MQQTTIETESFSGARRLNDCVDHGRDKTRCVFVNSMSGIVGDDELGSPAPGIVKLGALPALIHIRQAERAVALRLLCLKPPPDSAADYDSRRAVRRNAASKLTCACGDSPQPPGA